MNILTGVNEIDFMKMQGLVPTIIQEENKTVLSLVYSSKESLEKTIATNTVWRFSRAQNKVCQKGATSKNTQELVEIKVDCDKDALLFIVRQKGTNACHTGEYSCFGTQNSFDLATLYATIEQRIKNPQEGSYTKTLVDDELLLKRKLVEEAAEVITAKNRKELVWECADLLYFLFVIMAKEGIAIKDIECENNRRNQKK